MFFSVNRRGVLCFDWLIGRFVCALNASGRGTHCAEIITEILVVVFRLVYHLVGWPESMHFFVSKFLLFDLVQSKRAPYAYCEFKVSSWRIYLENVSYFSRPFLCNGGIMFQVPFAQPSIYAYPRFGHNKKNPSAFRGVISLQLQPPQNQKYHIGLDRQLEFKIFTYPSDLTFVLVLKRTVSLRRSLRTRTICCFFSEIRKIIFKHALLHFCISRPVSLGGNVHRILLQNDPMFTLN